MKTLSLCVIVKDEELTLERLLSTATSFADEIVVVDTGSTDKSKQIAQKYANVYDFLWIDDFSAARNYAIELCTCDLVIWLDADDVVPQETVKKINELKLDFDCDMVTMPYETGNLRFYRERIFLNDGSHFFKGEVHEAIELKGKIKRLECPVIHDKKKSGDPMRNLRILKKVYASRPLNDRELFYYASELYFTGSSDARSELWRFIKFYGRSSRRLSFLPIKERNGRQTCSRRRRSAYQFGRYLYAYRRKLYARKTVSSCKKLIPASHRCR